MDYYDFRNRLNSQSSSSSPHPMYGPSSLYPKIGHSGGHPPPARNNTTTASSSAGMGIRVTLKPEFRITPPPQMSPHIGEIPRSTFQFDFELERKILAEAEKENPDWGKLGLENLHRETAKTNISCGRRSVGVHLVRLLANAISLEAHKNSGASVDPVMGKYIATGLNRDAVSFAVAKYGDNPIKVREFVSGYMVLREMGFEANRVAEALIAHDNDKEAAAHFLTTSS